MFSYVDGQEVLVGDLVLMTDAYPEGVKGTIAEIFLPGSDEAGGYGVGGTGGILIELESGELFTWEKEEIDSHLTLLHRALDESV